MVIDCRNSSTYAVAFSDRLPKFMYLLSSRLLKSRLLDSLLFLVLLVVAGTAASSSAYLPKTDHSRLADKEIPLANLPEPVWRSATDFSQADASQNQRLLQDLEVTEQSALFDQRSGRVNALWLSHPVLPGAGIGNELSWDNLGFAAVPGGDALNQVVIERLHAFLELHANGLQVDISQMRFNVGAHGDLVQIHAQREVDGVPVMGAGFTATISHGNLVLLGLDHWADVNVPTSPSISTAQAQAVLLDYLDAQQPDRFSADAVLTLIPFAADVAGQLNYAHRLVWLLPVEFDDVPAGYQGAVDAHTGTVIAFWDTYHAQDARNIKGGVYPLSNDGIGVDGVEVPGYPMPFADVNHVGGVSTADSGGNVLDVSGPMTTELAGPFVAVDDFCGAVSETSDDGDLDLGTSGGIDCDTPPGASAGNTHSSRTSFYELNRIAELARGQLPGNTWVRSQLTAELNISVVCNAFWTGTVVQFFRSSGTCSNLGELAGVIDHEWGHGMDDNGTNGTISSPGEGIADVFSALRINDSCPGRGALPNTCGGFGDPCIPSFGCTAARDIDWERHESQQPHNVAWANANCGGSPHCRGMLNSEAAWDLLKRDLPNLYGLDNNTSLEITTRLTYLGADNVASWFVSNNGEEGGCAASSGYQQHLAADDDNGNLNDGTPHMQAIFDAFNRHGIACNMPVVQDSGCADVPTVAPTVTGSSADRGATLNWNSIPGATRYKVFRTDGVQQCDYGKAIVGETASTTFTDAGLQNDREYYYVVAGFTDTDACMGPTSSCVTVTAGEESLIFANGFEE